MFHEFLILTKTNISDYDDTESEVMDLGGHSDSDIEWAEDSSGEEQMEESDDLSETD